MTTRSDYRPSSITRLLPALSLALLATACASGPQASPNDPIEPFNRVIFTINDKADEYVATPLAKGYRAVTPQPVRTAITNFYSNLADVGNFVNNVLQGKGVDAAETFMRIAVNSTLGIGGLIDIATPAGLSKHAQDFGLTMGVWGIPSGPYLVLPLFGPSSIRDGIGLYVNFQISPTTWVDQDYRYGLYFLGFLDARTNALGATDLLTLAALDKYSFVRDGYLQRRQYLIDGGSGKLPQYEDDDAPADAAPAAAPGAPASAPASAPAATPAEATAAPVPPPAGGAEKAPDESTRKE
ncbi:VacJ family lipoprotein [Cupriavidus sp. 2TAF22]|uniref:MlaA family lipoprotein n=1 Tax=unclassified Cupriavidus TaxID=2640874 RepID=UPI003F927395